MNRAEKSDFITTLNKSVGGSAGVVVVSMKGLNAAETTEWRKQIRGNGLQCKVAKNRLAKRALTGTVYADLANLLKGPTALVYGNDPVSPAKIAVEFANKNDKVSVLGGALPGKVLDKASVVALSKLPSLNELRAKIIGVLQAPATKVVSVLQAPARDVVGVITAYSKKS